MQTKQTRTIATLAVLCSTLLIQGCGQEIDAKQATNISGLLYKLNDSDPFTGTITNFPASYDMFGTVAAAACSLPVKKGRPDGTTKCVTSQGVKVVEVDFKEGVRDGSEQVWDRETGNLISSAHWSKGHKDGKQENYNPANKKQIILINWSNGNKVDEEKRWSLTGDVVLTDLRWKDGKATGFIKTVETLTGNENIVEEASYKDGVLDGAKKRYSINAAQSSGVGTKGGVVKYYLSSQENYVNGKQDGLQQAFGATGEVFAETQYSNGVQMELTKYAVVNGKRTQILHKVNINPAATDPSQIQFSFVKDGKEICLDESGNVTCEIDWAKGKPLKGCMQMKITGDRGKQLVSSFCGVPNASGDGLVKDGVEKRTDEKSGQPDSDIIWSKGVISSGPKQDDADGQFPTQSW
ncbi:MAG: hypothetical protein H6R19_218 [Proteobacteria bacterium]|nr:hypothetical protein [Pseudomonadota bacterium]